MRTSAARSTYSEEATALSNKSQPNFVSSCIEPIELK